MCEVALCNDAVVVKAAAQQYIILGLVDQDPVLEKLRQAEEQGYLGVRAKAADDERAARCEWATVVELPTSVVVVVFSIAAQTLVDDAVEVPPVCRVHE